MSNNQISNDNNLSFVTLNHDNKSSSAIISMNEGGRLKELVLNNKTVIKEIDSFKYSKSYASSVLFPFASRIENGRYTFNNKEYKLECNDSNKNALHGLVYNKTFKIVKVLENPNFSSVTIAYKENQKTKGFPFQYTIALTYTLYRDEITLLVTIKNIDNTSFPFTLGWHPYFITDNLSRSFLKFKSDQKIKFNENLITQKVIEEKIENEFKIENNQLDDCFILDTDTVEFITPNYQIKITTNQLENYLQLYTPKDLPLIAIEPMTGISNSFNNKIGLQTLEPNQSHSVSWSVRLKH